MIGGSCDRSTLSSVGSGLGQAKELAFFPVATESTKAAAQSVTGLRADKERQAQWKTNGGGCEGRWETREVAAAVPWLCCVSELARTSQARGGERPSLHPSAAICSFTQAVPPPTPEPTALLLPTLRQWGGWGKGGLW